MIHAARVATRFFEITLSFHAAPSPISPLALARRRTRSCRQPLLIMPPDRQMEFLHFRQATTHMIIGFDGGELRRACQAGIISVSLPPHRFLPLYHNGLPFIPLMPRAGSHRRQVSFSIERASFLFGFFIQPMNFTMQVMSPCCASRYFSLHMPCVTDGTSSTTYDFQAGFATRRKCIERRCLIRAIISLFS